MKPRGVWCFDFELACACTCGRLHLRTPSHHGLPGGHREATAIDVLFGSCGGSFFFPAHLTDVLVFEETVGWQARKWNGVRMSGNRKNTENHDTVAGLYDTGISFDGHAIMTMMIFLVYG